MRSNGNTIMQNGSVSLQRYAALALQSPKNTDEWAEKISSSALVRIYKGQKLRQGLASVVLRLVQAFGG